MKQLRAFLPLIVLIAIGVTLFFSGAFDRFEPSRIGAEQENLRTLIAQYPILARLAQVVIVLLGISTGIPGVIVLIFAGGMLFGIIEGTILSGIGTTIGATILFVASRSASAHGTGSVPVLVERLRSGYHAFPFSYTMFLRLVPFFPFGGVTVALAWLRCPLWLFVTATALGGTVMIAFETALGAGLADTIAREGAVSLSVFAHKRVLVPLLGMAVLALAPIVLGQLRKKGARGEVRGPEDETPSA
jgi:uncharacterized membrane protein YdjX (TVP38/TMEM64 family)